MSQKNIVEYGRALVSVLKAFEVLEPKANWFERELLKVLRRSYQSRLRHLVDVLPNKVSEAILRPDHRTGLDADGLTADDLSFQLDMEDSE